MNYKNIMHVLSDHPQVVDCDCFQSDGDDFEIRSQRAAQSVPI